MRTSRLILAPRQPTIPQYPVDGRHGGYGVGLADARAQQALTDLPREHAGVLLLQSQDLLHDRGGCHLLERDGVRLRGFRFFF